MADDVRFRIPHPGCEALSVIAHSNDGVPDDPLPRPSARRRGTATSNFSPPVAPSRDPVSSGRRRPRRPVRRHDGRTVPPLSSPKLQARTGIRERKAVLTGRLICVASLNPKITKFVVTWRVVERPARGPVLMPSPRRRCPDNKSARCALNELVHQATCEQE